MHNGRRLTETAVVLTRVVNARNGSPATRQSRESVSDELLVVAIWTGHVKQFWSITWIPPALVVVLVEADWTKTL
jgi:hypothetical protein